MPLIRLTEGAPDSLASDYIEYTTCVPDYPKTSAHGYSYIVEKKDSLHGNESIKAILDEVRERYLLSDWNILIKYLAGAIL